VQEKVSEYIDRYVLFKGEGTWGTWNAPDTFPNYLLEFEGTTTEERDDQPIIAGAPDLKARTFQEEGVVARMLMQVVSSKIFEYCLGSHAVANTASPFTIGIGSTLPSMSIYRGLQPGASGETGTISVGYYGMKVDTWELTLEKGEDVVLELNFAGKGCTVPSAMAKPSVSVTIPTFGFYHGEVVYGPTTLAYLNRIALSGNNNLDARLSAGSLTFRPVKLREGERQLTGRMSIDSPLSTFATDVLARGESSIIVYLRGSTANQGTLTFTIRNIALDEYPDPIRGLDAIEAEIPFSARGSVGYDMIQLVQTSALTWAQLPY